jgi:chitodextrinase
MALVEFTLSIHQTNTSVVTRAAIVSGQLVSNPPLPRISARQANAVTSLPHALPDMGRYYDHLVRQPQFTEYEQTRVNGLVGVNLTAEERCLMYA